jgi:hypothetical protein
LDNRKCFYWWVQKPLIPFAVQSPRKSQITLKEVISFLEVHLPSLGAYSLVWRQNIAHCKPGRCNARLLFSWLHQTHIFSMGLARASKWPMFSLYIDQEINALWSEDYRVTHRVYSMNV